MRCLVPFAPAEAGALGCGLEPSRPRPAPGREGDEAGAGTDQRSGVECAFIAHRIVWDGGVRWGEVHPTARFSLPRVLIFPVLNRLLAHYYEIHRACQKMRAMQFCLR